MKKKLLTLVAVILAAAALVAASVAGTVAYLTASSAVSNVFTVGNIAISMPETKVKPDGTATGEPRTDTNSYHLVPGHTYIKDPTIFITSETDEMYLFVKSSNQIRSIENGNRSGATEAEKATTMRKQMEANGWVEFVQSGDGIEIVWVYGTRDENTGLITPTPVDKNTKQTQRGAEVTAGEFQLCGTFTIAGNAKVDTYAAAKVTFTAFAIQTTAMNNDVKTAWEAIKDSFPYEGGIANPKNPYTNQEGFDPYAPYPGVSSGS